MVDQPGSVRILKVGRNLSMLMLRSAAVGLAAAMSAAAQCSMCQRNAEALTAQQASSLNLGIGLLLAAPMLLLGAFVVLLYRRRAG